MQVTICSDIDWESKVDHATRALSLRDAFDEDFGLGFAKISITLNCRDPKLVHKQRVRHVTAANTLYVDVMLELPYFVQATHVQRRAKIAEQVVAQLAIVLAKRRAPKFAATTFLASLATVLNEQLNGLGSDSFDHLCLERAAGT